MTDGQQVLDYMNGADEFSDRNSHNLPFIIILDINMPKLSSFETLTALKADEKFKTIPVVMLSSSENKKDIESSYLNGASGYVTKPIDFNEICELAQTFCNYWSKIMKVHPYN